MYVERVCVKWAERVKKLDLRSIYHTRPFASYNGNLKRKFLLTYFMLSFESVRILMRKRQKLFKQEITRNKLLSTNTKPRKPKLLT